MSLPFRKGGFLFLFFFGHDTLDKEYKKKKLEPRLPMKCCRELEGCIAQARPASLAPSPFPFPDPSPAAEVGGGEKE